MGCNATQVASSVRRINIVSDGCDAKGLPLIPFVGAFFGNAAIHGLCAEKSCACMRAAHTYACCFRWHVSSAERPLSARRVPRRVAPTLTDCKTETKERYRHPTKNQLLYPTNTDLPDYRKLKILAKNKINQRNVDSLVSKW